MLTMIHVNMYYTYAYCLAKCVYIRLCTYVWAGTVADMYICIHVYIIFGNLILIILFNYWYIFTVSPK